MAISNVWLLTYMPNLIFAAVIILGTVIIEFLIGRIYKSYRKKYGTKQGVQLTETALRVLVLFVGILLLLSSIPGLSSNAVRLVFAAIGVILALSSTTIIANGVSGIVIKMMGQYRVGDMVKIAGNIGKVSEIGALQTELQNPKRGIVKLPNSLVLKDVIFNYSTRKYIVNVPVTIGYDVDRRKVEMLLVSAVKDTGLKNPFVFVLELGNNWVKYEANGLLEDTTKLVIVESNLRKNILDRFNLAGIEILSPEYVTLEKISATKKILPPKTKKRSAKLDKQEVAQEAKKAEDVMFEKAKVEEEQAKRDELTKQKILEAMKEHIEERNRVADWMKTQGSKVSVWKKPEAMIEQIATSSKITVAELKNFFGKSEAEMEKEKVAKEKKKKKPKPLLKI
jgi:small-conductance mechanosensitive channel|tara:strand:- start:2597 stop:3781 length:1185 start_codon:yes stop_codon:yes gene_type:complete